MIHFFELILNYDLASHIGLLCIDIEAKRAGRLGFDELKLNAYGTTERVKAVFRIKPLSKIESFVRSSIAKVDLFEMIQQIAPIHCSLQVVSKPKPCSNID